MRKLLIAVFMTSVLLPAFAAEEKDDFYKKYFTITEVNTQYLGEVKGGTIPLNGGNGSAVPAPGELPKPPTGPQINPPVNPNAGPSVNDTVNAIDKIVNLAEKIFGIIKENKPVVNITTNYANAVPYGTSHWTQLQGWSKPSTRKYAFSMKNGFGSEVVKVVYQVHWTHSGNFQGKGKFLTGVTVEPISVNAAWGYTVDLTAEVPDSTVANVGTSEDPIASMQVQLNWKISTVIKVINEKAIYYVQGDGFMEQIASPFESKKRAEEEFQKNWEMAENLILNTSWH